MANSINQGQAVQHLREKTGISQEMLANALGKGWSAKQIEEIEQLQEVDPGILQKIAKALNIDRSDDEYGFMIGA